VRVEPQTRAEREKNPGGRPGSGRPVRRTKRSRRGPGWFAVSCPRDRPANTRDKAGGRRVGRTGFGGLARSSPG
jgi:hypothetical protein